MKVKAEAKPSGLKADHSLPRHCPEPSKQIHVLLDAEKQTGLKDNSPFRANSIKTKKIPRNYLNPGD